jgi:hypothetical protein
MSILADHQYTLNDYYIITKIQDISELNQDVIDNINNLAKRVGAPTYKKTPIFKHSNRNIRRRHHVQSATITAADWEAMRNFKTTFLEKPKEGIDTEIEKIRCQLNKLTKTNYEDICQTIKLILSHVLQLNVDKSELEKVGIAIFEIGSINTFWSDLYARLYKDLIDQFPIMRSIYEKNFTSFITLFDSIRFIKSEEDYDLFCQVNAENEKRRALGSFFVHLMMNNVIKVDDIVTLIHSLIEKFTIYKKDREKKNEIGEIGENLCILIGKGFEALKNHRSWETIENFIREISELKTKEYPGISSKTIFKFLDLSEEL